MKHITAMFIGLIMMLAGFAVPAGAETDVGGGSDHPLLSRMPGFYMSDYKQVELGNFRFVETAGKTGTVSGRKTTIEYRLMKGKPLPGELKIRIGLQDAVKQNGGSVVFDDDFNRCSTLVFKKDGRETWIDVRAYDSMYRLTIVEKEDPGTSPKAATKFPERTVDPAVKSVAPGRVADKIPAVQNVWPQWIEGAKKDIRTGIPMWIRMLGLKEGIVNGARVSGGYLGGPAPLVFGSMEMKLTGSPDRVTSRFMAAVSEAFSFWAASVRVPDLPWYPTFEVFPGPLAPPTPSPATPLSALIQSTAFLDPSMLSMNIRSRIGDEAASPEAKTAIDEFCNWLYSGFMTWRTFATLSGVLGTGPVPTFNPDARIYSGPVINGTANGGTISPVPSWP
jgi:hypothetical protein